MMIIGKKGDTYLLETSLEEILDIKEALAVRIYAAEEYSKGEFTIPAYMDNQKRMLHQINWWIHGEREWALEAGVNEAKKYREEQTTNTADRKDEGDGKAE